MAATDSEEIKAKLDNGSVKISGRNGKLVTPKPKKPKSTVQSEGEAHQAEDAKAGTNAPDETPKTKKAEKKAPAPKAPKVAEFPAKGTINPYGFIGVSVALGNAIGLKVIPKEKRTKASAKYKETPIEFKAFNPETKELTIKIP